MIGVWLLATIGVGYELWAELAHAETITAGVRSLPLPGRLLVAGLLVALAAHLATPASWAVRHDPLDRGEHELHRWFDEQRETNP